ncbi:hypothetical protein SAMN05421640_0606 [Ekhidna lutea]|uniref:Adhesin domain-containing protein n=1 Tax=Ekhidna lutea TaxID=447679 RepID=A0A239FDI7_EKHLU|nr:hypothetical protein SAMN05421640_0606 [Ekhidna lutea]
MIALFLAIPLLAQVRQERDFKRSFSVPQNAKVEVVSKYGEVIIRTWELDSVKFNVVVRAEGKNSSAVAKSMSRVDIKFRKIGSVISAVTEIGSSGGIFGNVMNEVGGVIGSNKLKVDYQVWIPKDVMLSVENKYGDIYLTDLDGKVDLDVSHGDIKANDFSKSLNLKHSFGKASFGELNDGIFTLRGAEIRIDAAQDLNIESGSSEIRVDKVSRIQLNSRNDKIHLLDATEIMCEGSFTNLTSDLLRGSARLDFSYGDIYLSRIVKDFNSIDITGKSTDINLILNQASYTKTYIKGPEDRMILPNSMLTMQKQQFVEEEKISLSGFVGNTNTRHSQLLIEADGGELIIAIKETPIFVDKD